MDLRFAIRLLVKSPGFTLTAILTLALGIGLNTVVFTFYDAVAWKPLAVLAPGEMVRVVGQDDGRPIDLFSYPEFEELRGQSMTLQAMTASSGPIAVLSAGPDEKPNQARVIHTRLTSTDYFDALGVKPVIGRSFGPGESTTAVLSHAYWRQHLNSDPSVVGKTMWIQGISITIAGVAPAEFLGTGLPAQTPDLWLPLTIRTVLLPNANGLQDRTIREWQLLARKKAGVSIDQISAELTVIAQRWPVRDAKTTQLRAKRATFFQTDGGEFEVFGAISLVLLTAVDLILLMGCVNLVNLFSARNAARSHELAVRLALGASRWRLIRQLCTESVVLGVAGGALGLLLSLYCCEALSAWALGALRSMSGGTMAPTLDLMPDWRIYTYTGLLSLLTGMAIGVWPAIRSAGAPLSAALKRETGAERSKGWRWNSRDLLIAAQLASCLILLAGAGLLFRGAWQSEKINPGFDTGRIAVLSTDVQTAAQTPVARQALLRNIADRVANLPEVASVARMDRPPFLGHGSGVFESQQAVRVSCLFNSVSDTYFETIGIPFLDGRNFTTAESERKDPVVIISEAAARSFWPGVSPLGQRLRTPPWLKQIINHDSITVIGVVKGVRSTYLSKDDNAFVYFPKSIVDPAGSFLLRTRVAPDGVFPSVFAALSAIDVNLPSQTSLTTLEQGPVQLQVLMAKAPAAAASMLGALALILATVGIYGVVSFLVVRRTREIGIRLALGARNQDVIRMVLQQSLRPVMWGTVVGFAGALGLSSLLASFIVMPDVPDLTYGAGAFHPATFAAVLAVLTAAVLVASFVPVRRATRVEPARALRDE